MNWYLWGSYGATFFLLLMEIIFLLKRTKDSETKA